MTEKTFGERLKKAREDAGLLQSQVAEMCNLKSATIISNWEKNYNQPDLNKLLTLCEVLQVSPNYLVGYTPPDLLPSMELDHNELELIQRLRTLDERGTATVMQTIQLQEEFINSFNNDRKNLPLTETNQFPFDEALNLPDSVFLTRSDAEYDMMKRQARGLKSLKKTSYRSFEDITKFLWDLGYNERICLSYVIQVFNGTKVPCQLLFKHISSYLSHRIRYSFVEDTTSIESVD